MDLRDYIASIDDFPKSGIRFYDISTLLAHPSAWRFCVQQLVEQVSPLAPDLIIGIESRGFLTAAPIAYELGCGFAMMRKKGKLPGDVQFYEYELEYGNDTLEIQSCAIDEGQRVVIMDDLLATGGTVAAAIELIHKAGGVVAGASFVIELGFLAGRDRLNSYDVPLLSLVNYE